MRKSYMKADRLHPYQKTVHNFWDTNVLYSESTKDYFRQCAAEFDLVKKKVIWETKPVNV
jgi:hypothetical protein